MADEDQESKTEEASQRKLEEARKRGQVVVSQEVKHWFGLAGGLLIVLVFAPLAVQRMGRGLGGYLSNLHAIPTDRGSVGRLLLGSSLELALVLAAPLAVVVALAVAASVVQHGFLVSAEHIKPKFSKINPVSGFKKLFSGRALIEFAKGLVKLTVVGVVATVVLMPEFRGIESVAGLAPPTMMERAWSVSVRLMGAVLVAMAVMALLDYMWQRFQFMKQQRMTKQEVKEEYKQSEGDPQIKGRIRQLRMERSRRRMMAAVPTADVVITNPTHFAVAVKYDPEAMAAPRVVAKGADAVAARIREVATENNVTIVENPPVARALYAAVELDQEIPPEHYKAVAEIISYVFRLRRRPMPAAAR